MNHYTFFLTDSLEKVFPASRPRQLGAEPITVLQGELPAVQLVYHKAFTPKKSFWRRSFDVEVSGSPVPARLRRVDLLPSDFPAYERQDDNYITKSPGLFPDLLSPMRKRPQGGYEITPLAEQFRAVWIDFPQLAGVPAQDYTVKVRVCAEEKTELPNGTTVAYPAEEQGCVDCEFTLRVLPAELPAQTLLHTEWLHADCLASYYNTPVFSEKHWQILEHYIALAGQELGVNMMLTPVFTPPLDTAVGGERLAVQLVDIAKEGEEYQFGFDKLERWCAICKKYGITHLEISHFFTQWGAKATPKIMAQVNGKEEKIFGWHVPSNSLAYRRFLEQFVPALREMLPRFGYDNAHVAYHISDEPSEHQLDIYKAAKAQVADLLEGCFVMDALSDYAFYANGLVEHPVPANDHIAPFIENKVPNLWVYYCCTQCVNVANRFYAMPSARNRVMGLLMYLYDIAGFLHWGYNFYNAQYSLRPINPYVNTHASYAFPSGDPYLVYPGENGEPLASIRSQVQRQALDDLAALRLLESFAGRPAVEELIYHGVEEPITFEKYPTSAEYFINLRQRLGEVLAQHL